MSTRGLEIAMGAMSPPLAQQIKDQGCKISSEDADRYQRRCNEVTNLMVCGYILPSVADKARQKIIKDIANVVSE